MSEKSLGAQSATAVEGAGSIAPDAAIARRACECRHPDPVMQADGKFYCHQCSFETGARPAGLEPERWMRESRDLLEALKAILEHDPDHGPSHHGTKENYEWYGKSPRVWIRARLAISRAEGRL